MFSEFKPPVFLPSPTCGRGAGGEGAHRKIRFSQRLSLPLTLSHKWARGLLNIMANQVNVYFIEQDQPSNFLFPKGSDGWILTSTQQAFRA